MVIRPLFKALSVLVCSSGVGYTRWGFTLGASRLIHDNYLVYFNVLMQIGDMIYEEGRRERVGGYAMLFRAVKVHFQIIVHNEIDSQ